VGGAKDEEVIVRRGQWTWRIQPELADKLDELESMVLSPESRSSARLVKVTTGRRTIWLMTFPETSAPGVFVKFYSRPKLIKQVKYLFRASRTRQEWNMARIADDLDIPAARALAMGEKKRLGLLTFDVLIQEYLADYIPFDKYFLKTPPGPERDDLIMRLALLVRRIHDLGIIQRDFKPDSIMIRQISDGLDLRLVDLERARYLKRKLKTRERIENLAKLSQTFERVATPQDHQAFFQAYFQEHRLSAEDSRMLCQEISDRAERIARKWAWEMRSWVRTENELYYNFYHGPWHVYAHESMPEHELIKILDKEEGIEEGELSLQRKRQSEPSRLKIRECRPAFRMKARGYLRGALYGFENSIVLSHRGIPPVRPYAAIQRRFFGKLRKGYLIMEPPARLTSLEQAWEKARVDAQKSALFLSGLGALLGRLNKIGFISAIPLESVINLVEREGRGPDFYIDHPEMLFLERRGTSKPGEDMVSRIGTLLELKEEERDILRKQFLASGPMGQH
jgi:hypothetical protein